MSGYYNYHPTISKPGEWTVQTASQQPPFYFGGSQVLVNILPPDELMKGNGLKRKRKTKEK